MVCSGLNMVFTWLVNSIWGSPVTRPRINYIGSTTKHKNMGWCVYMKHMYIYYFKISKGKYLYIAYTFNSFELWLFRYEVNKKKKMTLVQFVGLIFQEKIFYEAEYSSSAHDVMLLFFLKCIRRCKITIFFLNRVLYKNKQYTCMLSLA